MKLGIISDIHEDRVRLEEAFHLLDRHGCHEVACLGDVAGFTIPSFAYHDTRDASLCLQQVRKNCRYIVAGNHDLSPARKIPQHKAGFDYPENWYDLDYRERQRLAGDLVWLNEEVELDSLLSQAEKEFIRMLPEYLPVACDGLDILLSHYLYPDLSGSSRKYYEEFGPVSDHLDFILKEGCLIGFSGHQHAEGAFRFTRKGMNRFGFGDVRLQRELQWIVGPPVANGKNENGCLVLDTETLQLNVIPLQTPPRVMRAVPYNK